jgi:P4 family phage/plasmid primase-like protien
MAGKVWHREDRKGLYLNLIDCDNKKAIDEIICTINGSQLGLEEAAQHTIVEQHAGSPNKAHLYVYSDKPFAKKSSDNGSSLAAKIDANEIPAVEIKGEGGHGVHNVTPSIHPDGTIFQILGTKEVAVVDDFDRHIDDVLKRYDIGYLSAVNSDSNKSQIPIEELFEDDYVVLENHNRHESLLRVMESLIKRNMSILALDEIKEWARKWDNKHCSPALNNKEFEKQWKSATAFISKSKSKSNTENGETHSQSEDDNESEYPDLADELIEKFHLHTIKVVRDIYFFDSRRYVNHGNIVIEKELEARYLKALAVYQEMTASMTPEEIKKSKIQPPMPWTRKRIDEFLGHVERRTYLDVSAFNANLEWLACDNCMLNLRTGQTEPFSPEFMNTTQIPVKYSDAYAAGDIADFFRLVERHASIFTNSQCPKIMKFLHDIVEADDVELLLDFMAYCLWRNYKYANWLLLDGYGQNGNSVFLNLIEKFLGKDNTSSESLERLLNERFAAANLYQKLANIDADVSGDILIKNTGKLKKLTGNDEYPGEFKYKTPFKFRNYAKLICSCNEIAETNDTTDAFFRRLIIVNFTQQFLAEKDDPHIIDKLCTEEEFTGLLHELLGRLPRIIAHGIRPTTNETIKETYEKYMRGTNPIAVMYESYRFFCHAKKIAPESEQSFSRKLTKEFGFQVRQFRKEGKKVWCWVDVRIIDWRAVEDDEQQTLAEYSPQEQQEMR